MSDKKSVHTKLDEILKSIQVINARINNLKESIQDINKHLETLNKKLTMRCDELEMKINQKVDIRGGVEDTRLEAKAKDSLSEDKPSRGQGQECSRPRIKDSAASVLQKKKVFIKVFQAISNL